MLDRVSSTGERQMDSSKMISMFTARVVCTWFLSEYMYPTYGRMKDYPVVTQTWEENDDNYNLR